MDAARCSECGLDSGVPVEEAALPRWARWMGVVVGTGMLAWIVLLAVLAADPVTQQQSHWGASLSFVDPAVSRGDLAELSAAGGEGRERLVRPLRRMLGARVWAFPFTQSAIVAQMVEVQGTWSRSAAFGKPLAWVVRAESGPLDGAHGLAVPARAAAGQGVDISWEENYWVQGADPTIASSALNVSVGGIAAAACVVLAGSWVGALVWRRARRREGAALAGLVGAVLMTIGLVAWAVWGRGVDEGRAVRFSSTPMGVEMEVLALNVADLGDGSLTDARLAAIMLEKLGTQVEGVEAKYLAVGSWPRHDFVESRWVAGLPGDVVSVTRDWYMTRGDAKSTPLVLPREGWHARVENGYAWFLGGADGVEYKRLGVGINLGWTAIYLLPVLVVGRVAGVLTRRWARRRMRYRRGCGFCVGCGYVLREG